MILTSSLPHDQTFFRHADLHAGFRPWLRRFLCAFLLHFGRMSASRAAASAADPRHRANATRFLRRGDLPNRHLALWQRLLRHEPADGLYLFLLDSTYCGQQGRCTENTFGTGHYGRRQQHPRKHNDHKKKRQRRCCHGFVVGLLLTPSGLRLPVWQSYYTRAYCPKQGRPYRTQVQLAAQLVDELWVPTAARVVVLGDTAFDAACVQQACRRRHFGRIVPINASRVLAGPKSQRRKVLSLATGWSADGFAPVRLTPGQGRYVAQRREARCRLGPHAKSRTFWVHTEQLDLHRVGVVQAVFSTMIEPKAGKPVVVQKVLMAEDLPGDAAEVVELYDLRWQIELFFKEVKGTLGLHQYRFRRFEQVERWVQVCLLSFVYLEWYRAWTLRRRRLTDKERRWWQRQRSYGLCQAVRQEMEQEAVRDILQRTRTPGGLRALRRRLRQAVPLEYRPTG